MIIMTTSFENNADGARRGRRLHCAPVLLVINVHAARWRTFGGAYSRSLPSAQCAVSCPKPDPQASKLIVCILNPARVLRLARQELAGYTWSKTTLEQLALEQTNKRNRALTRAEVERKFDEGSQQTLPRK